MRLAIFAHWLPESEGRAGEELRLSGARAVHDIAQGLSVRGHSVVVYSFSPKPPSAAYEVVPLPGTAFFRRNESRYLLDGLCGNILALFPSVADCDAVLSFDEGLFLPLKNKNTIRVFHESAALEARYAGNSVDKVFRHLVAAEQSLTAQSYRWMKARSVATSASIRAAIPGVTNLIPSGVDRATFFPFETDRAPQPTILFHGSLEGRRRGAELCRWFRDQIYPAVRTARLVLLGCSGIDGDGLFFVPHPTEEEYARWFRRAWVFAMPSRFEWSATAYLEAMASGTPVVASPNAESSELLGQGKYGFLCDDEHFADTIASLITDTAERKKWCAIALRRAESFDLAHTLNAYEALLAAPR